MAISHRFGLPVSRRDLLARMSTGFGWLAASTLLAEQARSDGPRVRSATPTDMTRADDALRPRPPHFPAKVDHVIFLFMDGGVSQVDTFDPKPRLDRENGRRFPMPIEATQFDQNGLAFASPFRFARHGESGLPVSDLFPHLSRHVDDICFIRSMKSPFAEHTQSTYLAHIGSPQRGRPSMGAWVSYGLGTLASDLPSYVVIDGGQLALGGLSNYSSGFLPAVHQGSLFHAAQGQALVPNLAPAGGANSPASRRFVELADRAYAGRATGDSAPIDAAIRNFELAFAMQSSVPDVADLARESQSTLERYGTTSRNPLTARYARQCLLARRLIERGVRFVELTCVDGIRFVAPWDSHGNLRTEHRQNADAVDQPVAALLEDLKRRGLFDRTLVVWGTEFGRTPFAQGNQGRDHNPHGYTVWLAGGGVRGGHAHGATDEFGYHAVENIVSVHDLHATILHLLGFDHTRLTYHHAGRDFRLTDVHGSLVDGVLA